MCIRDSPTCVKSKGESSIITTERCHAGPDPVSFSFLLILCASVETKHIREWRNEYVEKRDNIFSCFSFCLDAKRNKKIKANAIAPQALPSPAPFSVLSASFFFD